MADVFGDDHTPVDYLAYVAERFKGDDGNIDIAKLARAKYEADQHVKNVEAEANELRNEVKTRIGLEEFLTKVNTPPKNDDANNRGNPPPANDPSVDIETLVNQHLTKAEQARLRAQNRERVNTTLEKVWGSDTAKNFSQVSRDLGMPVKELQELAERSPDAFFRIAGVSLDNPRPPAGNIPQSTFSIGSDSKQGVRNQSYYRELKKTNPTLYFSTKTQMQMHQDANAQGEKFFN